MMLRATSISRSIGTANPIPILPASARALADLLSNAIRLAPTDSTVTVAGGSVRGWAWIAVQDDGPGIADEEQSHVFDRFKRATNGDNGSRRGSDLGLAIARQIVESHEGRLGLFSRLGEGSTFVMWLPDRAVADGPERSPAPPADCPLPRRHPA